MKKIELDWAQLKKQRLSFLLALIVIVGIGIAHFYWVVPAMEQRQDIRAHMKQKEQLIGKYQEKLSRAPQLKSELEQREQELKELQEGLFQGSDPYQFAATLAEPFSEEGSDDLVIKSYQVISTKEYGLYQEVKLKFSFTTSIGGFYQFLEHLQKNPSAILVENLNIRSMRRRTGSSLVVNVILAALMEKANKS